MQSQHYTMSNIPNLPASVGNFSGPVVFSTSRLENLNCILDASEDRGALYLGDTISIKRVDYLIRHDIQAILSCAPEAVFVHPGDPNVNVVASKFICAMDSMNYDISQNFEEAYEFIEENLAKGHNVLVHCHAGVSRSAAIVIAYVMKQLGLTADVALDLVKSRRNRIRPNENFRNHLKEYEERIDLNLQNIEREKERRVKYLEANPPASLPFNDNYSEYIESQSRSKTDIPLARREEDMHSKPQGISITELLTRPDLDSLSHRELEDRFNQYNSQLQNQLFGRGEAPKTVIRNGNEAMNGHYIQQGRPYDSFPVHMQRPRGTVLNPQRNVVYQPVQSQSVKTIMEKQLNKNKPKTTVVQGGLPDSYKTIAGMMTTSPSRYQTGEAYQRYT